MDATRRKLCVCGRSKAQPFCDNSHRGEGWTCAPAASYVPLVFVASARYENLGLKLASHFKVKTRATVYLPGQPPMRCARLVVLTDGADLEFTTAAVSQIEAEEVIVFGVGEAASALGAAFGRSPGLRIHALEAESPFEVFGQVVAGLEAPEEAEAVESRQLRRAFVSHAVLDEPMLLPVVSAIERYYGASMFVCAEGIPTGEVWQEHIVDALRGCEVFVVLLSEASAASHFCAFEIGMAYALEKPMVLIALDGVRPPAYIQHIQIVDLARLRLHRPWMEPRDLLMEQLVRALV